VLDSDIPASMILDNVNDAIIALDMGRHVVAWNRAAERVYGWPKEEVLGRVFTDVVPTLSYLDGSTPEQVAAFFFEQGFWQGDVIQRHHDGRSLTIAASVRLSYDEHGAPRHLIAINRDITEQTRTAAELRASEARLRALTRRLVMAHEEERKRLARDLHDQVGSALTAARLGLESLALSPDRPRREQHLRQSIHILEQTNQEIRALIFDLRPPHIDDLGLAAALRAWVEQDALRHGYRGQVHVGAKALNISSELAITCLRITQEALTNVVRYARAAVVVVAVQADDTRLELSITDDGQGFVPEQVLTEAVVSGHVGLVGMRERAELVGGHLEVESAPGKGTTIRAHFPLHVGMGDSTAP
jgi:PAS domain S-box-containing protein